MKSLEELRKLNEKELQNYYDNMNVIEKTDFYDKCFKDPCFFIEYCVMVPKTGGDELIELYEPQRDIVDTFIKEHYIILNKSRQTGASTIVQSLCAWLVIFYENYVIGVVSKSGSESSKFNKKILDIIDKIPAKFVRPSKEDFEERNAQSFKLRTTKSEVISQAVSLQNPEGILRGNTLALLVIDEAAFINKIEEAYTAIMPATSQAHKVAESKGVPFGTFIISTPNGTRGRGEFYFKLWMQAVKGESIYKPRSIHWRSIPNLDDKWYEAQCKLYNNDMRKIRQEYELEFLSSDGSLWDDNIQSHMNNILNSKEPEGIKILDFYDNGKLYILKPKYNHTKLYILGVDTASASGFDFSSVVVLEYESNEIIAIYVGKCEPLYYAKNVVKQLALMFPHNIIVVENSGGYGLTVLNYLADDEESYNIFGEDKKVGTFNNKKMKQVPGLSTNVKTRPLIIESMFNYIKEHYELINNKCLASELLTLENKNGKIQASKGFNDDVVMALGFACYVRTYSPDSFNNLEKRINNNISDNLSNSNDVVTSLIETIYTENNLNSGQNNFSKYGFTSKEYDKILNKYKNPKEKFKTRDYVLESYEDMAFNTLFGESNDKDEYSIYDDNIFTSD